MVEQVSHLVTSPFPYMVLILLAVMIVMIFVDVMPIAALTCITAIVMIISLVLGNHWQDKLIWDEAPTTHSHAHSNGDSTAHTKRRHNSTASQQVNPYTGVMSGHPETVEEGFATTNRSRGASSSLAVLLPSSSGDNSTRSRSGSESVSNPLLPNLISSQKSAGIAIVEGTDSDAKGLHPVEEINYPLTREEKMENMNEFFEDMFASIDYSLLLIFLGTFIVVANVDSTGIPKLLWTKIVGKVPFASVLSVVGISLFVLISSQFLGNVAVVQLCKPNVEHLDDRAKAYAWAVISFVATVGGNLTITGSAANIIVAEKVARLDPNSSLDFFKHYKVCFFVTLLSCAVGAAIITAEFAIADAIAKY